MILAPLLFCHALCSTAFPHDNIIRARRLSVSDGLSSNFTSCIFQDSKGFIWIGTREGLNKYDGYSFRPYLRRPFDSTGLQSDAIYAVTEDSSGYIWIATNGGLSRLNRMTDIITTYQHDPARPQSPISNGVTALHVDSHGTLWIGYYDGNLDCFEAGTQTFRHFGNFAAFDTRTSGVVHAILEDPQNSKLFICHVVCTTVFDLTLRVFEPSSPDIGAGIPSTQLHVCEDPSLHVWLTFFCAAGEKTSLFFRGSPIGNACFHGTSLFCTGASNSWGSAVYRGNGRYWLPLHESGLREINMETGTARTMSVTDGISKALVIDGAMTDRNRGVWFITRDGLFITDNRRNALHGEAVDFPQGSGNHQSVRALVFDHINQLWAGGGNGLMFRYDATAHRFDPVGRVSDSKGALAINSIIEDHAGLLWASATLGPWFNYHTTLGRSGAVQRRFALAAHGDRNAYGMLEDSDGILWGGTTQALDSNHSVLARIDPHKGTIQHYGYTAEKSTSNGRAVWTILERDRTSLWLGTAHGLYVFDKTSGTFVDRYIHDQDDVNSLSNDDIWVLHRTHDNKLWVGTWGGGLNCLDERSRSFSHLTIDNGLPSNYIRSILEDSAGNLWVATSKGISCYDPSRKTFRNYSSTDGLFDDEFEPNSCAISPAGEFYFGGTHGVTHFFPAQLNDSVITSPFMFTALHVFDKSRNGDLDNGDTVRLAHEENYFSIDYALLDYRAPSTKEYEYILEGMDRGWINANEHTSAVFHSVEPGTYVFRVRVTPASGNGGRREIHAVIIIASPWWETLWFRSSIALAGLAMIGIVVMKRKRDKRALDQLFDDAREKERLDIAGALHDGPLQDLYAARFFMPEAAPGSVPKHEGDSLRLDTLFKKVIRGLQTITGELQMPRFESGFATELQETCAAFQERHPEMEVHFDGIEHENAPVPKPVMQNVFRILRTTLTNVEKHSGASSLNVTCAMGRRKLMLRIADNGLGFKVDARHTTTGVTPHFGLLLMRSYVDAIHADLKISSVPDQGTEISVTVGW